MNIKPKVISLFSGIGGSSLGYELAGFKVVAAVEFLNYQAANYRLNHPNTKLYEDDIRKLNPLQILKDVKIKPCELDILDGSPPCSPFSSAGIRQEGWNKIKLYGNTKQRTDDLFLEYIRFLNVMKPKVFVAENVSGLIKGVSRGYFNEIINLFIECGYTVKAKLMNAANYGVPQKRERVFFIGIRNDLKLIPTFPTPQITKISLSEAFNGLLNSKKDLEEVNIERFSIYKELLKIKEGGKSNKYISLQKENKNKPCRTLTATSASLGAASICHWDNRKFTINECKAIAGFPQSFKLIGKNYKEKCEGLGRCVPPLVMKAIALHIKENILTKFSVKTT